MNSLTITLWVLAASILLSFFYGLFTRNYSTVDRLWSVLPVVYVIIWLPDFIANPRYIIAVILVLLWGARLTTNFAIKGGYAFSFKKGFTGEDYRWEILRKKIPNRFLFELFNLSFISAFQLILIFMFTLPLYYYGAITAPISVLEIILYALHLLLLSCELWSDILQLRFYRRRYIEPWNTERRYMLGFNTFGPWKYSRHPNYVCEMGQWVVIFLLLAAASGGLHFSGIGAAVLIILFAGSTVFAESITSLKYGEYKTWQKLSSAWLPLKPVDSGRRKAFLDLD
ncbi:MAG: DUF1295 domain-containing protein [Spirochaetales bacterium]|uniref:DUF1295 domain-containing protein n=1 Tax=Candidatus Thalassospirochaeta sargassi TaxID=3119039 RepID=A0AAJ1MLX2_9SPIO|nr:DUF1295 domain-containing protein [Spirochaetales bacterium]